jgi:hypothetical protein
LSRRIQLWNQGNLAAACCKIRSSGQASARAFMYPRLRGERPVISGDFAFRLLARRRICFFPSPLPAVERECPCQCSNTGEPAHDLQRVLPVISRLLLMLLEQLPPRLVPSYPLVNTGTKHPTTFTHICLVGAYELPICCPKCSQRLPSSSAYGTTSVGRSWRADKTYVEGQL